MKMTRLAVPGKCGALGASGLSEAVSSLSSAGKRLEPSSSERTICRRFGSISGFPSSIQRQKLVAREQHAQERGPRLVLRAGFGQELAHVLDLVGGRRAAVEQAEGGAQTVGVVCAGSANAAGDRGCIRME